MVQFLLLITTIAIAGLSSFASSTPTQPLGVISPNPHTCFAGDTAQFVRMEALGCTDQPCSWFRGTTIEIAVTFIPRTTTNTLRFNGKYKYGASNPEFGDIILSGTYAAGQTYRVARTLTLPQSLAPGNAELEVWLHDAQTRLINRCFRYTIGTKNSNE